MPRICLQTHSPNHRSRDLAWLSRPHGAQAPAHLSPWLWPEQHERLRQEEHFPLRSLRPFPRQLCASPVRTGWARTAIPNPERSHGSGTQGTGQRSATGPMPPEPHRLPRRRRWRLDIWAAAPWPMADLPCPHPSSPKAGNIWLLAWLQEGRAAEGPPSARPRRCCGASTSIKAAGLAGAGRGAGSFPPPPQTFLRNGIFFPVHLLPTHGAPPSPVCTFKPQQPCLFLGKGVPQGGPGRSTRP